MLHKSVITALLAVFLLSIPHVGFNQRCRYPPYKLPKAKQASRYLYGQASFYGAKFEGRKTSSGDIFRHAKFTAACNVVPLGTWLRVTNLRNGKSVLVRVNDRLHAHTKRIVDLTKASATKLGFTKAGLTRVKVEVLKGKP